MTVKVNKFGFPGFVKDVAEYDAMPEAWNDVRNVRFNVKGAETFGGHAQVLSPASINPLWLKVFPPISNPLWVYADLQKVFVFNGGHEEITRLSGLYNGTAQERWQGEVFQGLGIFNNTIDIPQLWSEFDAGQRLIDLPNWPATDRCKFLRPFKNFLMAGFLIESGNERPFRIRWSHPAAPGTYPSSWALNDPTKDSGEIDIAQTSDYLVDGLELGELFIVYKQKTAYAMQIIGRPDIFATWNILSTKGLLTRDCVQSYPGGHFVVGLDDIYTHTGQKGSEQSLVEGRLRDWIFNQISAENYFNCFTVSYERRSEIWFCFPEAGETYATIAVVWNRLTNGIGIRDIAEIRTEIVDGFPSQVTVGVPFAYPGPVPPSTGDDGDIWDLGEATPSAESLAVGFVGDTFGALKLVSMGGAEVRTITGWAKRTASTGTIISINAHSSEENNNVTFALLIDSEDNVLRLYSSVGETETTEIFDIELPTTNTWFFYTVQFFNDGGVNTFVVVNWAYLGDITFAPERSGVVDWATTGGAPGLVFDTTLVGDSIIGDDPLFGAVTQTRQWQVEFPLEEDLLAEMNSRTAVFPSPFSDNPMQGGSDFSDLSGNGYDWVTFVDHGDTPGPANGA